MPPRILFILFVSFLLISAAGCGDNRIGEIERGVAFAKSTLERTTRDPLAAQTLQEVLQTGGTVVSWITASMADPAQFPPFYWESPERPWSIVIRQESDSLEFLIEGYGEDVRTPVVIQKAMVELPDMG